ncbi:MAG: M16 family metallopeptidase, partial [Nitriliruptorales bacterium]
ARWGRWAPPRPRRGVGAADPDPHPLARVNPSVDFDRTDLPSGISVVTEHMPSVRSLALGCWIRVGSRDEVGADHGASHFLEHLLFKGTASRTARQIAEELEAVGGDMNAFTSKEYTCFYARVLDRDLATGVDVLGDMLRAATITPEDVDQERHVVLEEINVHYDTPEDLVHTDLARTLFGSHALAHEALGSTESITEMSRDRVHGYYANWYRPENLTVAAAGNLDHDEVVRMVEDVIGDLGRPGGEGPGRTAPDALAAGEVSIRTRPTEQAHVAIGAPGLRRDDDRRFALLVLNTLLGGGMSSRLFQEVREQRGLAYSTYSYHQAYGDGGYFGAYAGTTPAKVEDLLKVLRDELDRLAETVDADEVERAKGNVQGSVVLGLEDTGSRMTRLGKMIATDAELVTVDEALRRVDAVDLDAVRDLAGAILGVPRSLAIVGPFDDRDRDRFLPYLT